MITTTTDLMTTVALTRISKRGAWAVQYTTNDGAIVVNKDGDGTWSVGPFLARNAEFNPFVTRLASLEDAVDFILGARAMLAPVED